MTMKIGEFLLNDGKISQEQLDTALELQKKQPGKLGSVLIRQGYITEEDIAQVLSKQFGYPSINLSKFDIGEKVLELIKPDMARKHIIHVLNNMGIHQIAEAKDGNFENRRFFGRLRTCLHLQWQKARVCSPAP